MTKRVFFIGVGASIVAVFIGLFFWKTMTKDSRSWVCELIEIVVDDCETAEKLAVMSTQAGNNYRPWQEDPCIGMTAVECQVFLLRASIEAGCVHSTLADCNLGEVLFSLGRYQEAIEPLQGCVAKVDSANDLWYLAVAYYEVGDHSKARRAKKDLHRVRKRFPNRVDDGLGPLPF